MKTEIAIIPDFTAEQYYNSSDPYEWLYQYKNDKFLMKQLMQKMKVKSGITAISAVIFCALQIFPMKSAGGYFFASNNIPDR